MAKVRVGVVQRILPHYRVPFFNMLNEALTDRNIELKVFFGQERPGTWPKTEVGGWPWGVFRRNRYLVIGGREMVWQPCVEDSRTCDLVILEHSSRLLMNYIVQARWMLSHGRKLAFWGHGKNFQGIRSWSATEFVKRSVLRHCNWWFAYTEMSAKVVEDAGFPKDRTTIVQNAVDTSALRETIVAVEREHLDDVRTLIGLRGKRVGLFCGGMYPEKHLSFLVTACERVKELLPDFEMVFVGGGPESHLVQQACARNPWMHHVGPVFGKDRALYFSLSALLLMPGPVGLAIVDGFAARLPIFTTNIPTHGPEIHYLKHGENGWVTEHNIDAYSRAVAAYFETPALQEKLRIGCERSAAVLTLENMVSNFVDGVEHCLRDSGPH